jgi:chromosome partitioning protein
MKTLVFANNKGGVGKSALAVHFAHHLHELGRRVAVVDLDLQGNASFSLQDYRGEKQLSVSQLFSADSGPWIEEWLETVPAEGPTLRLIASDTGIADLTPARTAEASMTFRAQLEHLEGKFDYVLIDTAPALGAGLTAALYAADFVLSPIEVEVYSMIGLQLLLTTISNIRESNPNLMFLGMVPSRIDSRNPRHGRHVKELSETYPQFMIPHSIGNRSAVADALASRVPVWRLKQTSARAAAREIRALADYVTKKMEM